MQPGANLSGAAASKGQSACYPGILQALEHFYVVGQAIGSLIVGRINGLQLDTLDSEQAFNRRRTGKERAA
jgi:hypothetical protein